jgi:hypothetical protein
MEKKVELSEAEVKVALRDYIQKNSESYGIEYAWGLASLEVNGERVEEAVMTFYEEDPEIYEED